MTVSVHRLAFARAPLAMVVLGPSGEVIDRNEAARALVGDEWPTPSEAARLYAERAAPPGRRVRLSERRAIEVHVEALPEAEHALCTLRDELPEWSEALWHRFRESPLPMMVSAYEDGRYVDVNDAYVRMNGRSRETLIGHTTLELGLWRDPADRARLFAAFERRERVTDFEFDLVRGDGEIRKVRCWFERLRGEGRELVLSIVDDVTELRRVEAAHRASAARFAALHGSDILGIAVVDGSGVVREVNAAAARIVGRPMDELVGQRAIDFAPGPLERIAVARERIAAGADVPTLELSVPRADGTTVPILVGIAPLVEESLFLAFFLDLTELRRSERERDQLATLVDSSSDFIGIAGLDEVLTYVNAAGRALIGLGPDEPLAGLRISEMVDPTQLGRVEAEVLPALMSGRWTGEVRFKNVRTGKLELVDSNAFMVCDERGRPTGFANVARAIGERRALEEQLRHSQRMDALGRLAGGIAHDFNNMLSAILGFSSLVASALRVGDPMLDDVQQIIRAAERAAMLTRQLLAFSRRQMLEPRVVDVSAHIGDMERILQRVIGEDVVLKMHLAPNLRPVKVDPSQLEQVLLNLVINARDAMPEGGAITVETGNVTLDSEYVRVHGGALAGDYVLVSVSDTGTGMPEHVKARAFEPFFTTKEPGRGTGLGLSTVLGIVQQSGGHVWLYTEEGHGTQVKVYLPITHEALPDGHRAPVAVRESGSETVLLVEDEEAVRAFVRTTLRRQGYRVLEARNGGEALLVAEQHDGPIHLVITDVVMPRMNGKVLVERLLRIRPDLAVIYMSGYTENTVVHKGVVDAGTNFLAKPVSPDALLAMVRRVLDARDGAA